MKKTWHSELYRSISKCLPDGVYLSTEVGKAFSDDGIVDFYISTYKWAIELLIDGVGLKEHYNRFQKGIYIF